MRELAALPELMVYPAAAGQSGYFSFKEAGVIS